MESVLAVVAVNPLASYSTLETTTFVCKIQFPLDIDFSSAEVTPWMELL
jgi:hypothetical protein